MIMIGVNTMPLLKRALNYTFATMQNSSATAKSVSRPGVDKRRTGVTR
jgi:hypothetical protein